MTTIALTNHYWNFFADQTDQTDEAKSAEDQVARITQAPANPPDLGISVSDESTTRESMG